MPEYNILRTQKVKSRADITSAAEHNLRLRTQPNIDSSRSDKNRIYVNALGIDTKKASDLQEKLTDYYKSLGIKEKKDNVLMMEFVLSASPEFFKRADSDTKSKWVKEQIAFMQNEFGSQVKLAVLHLDETTPHLHFMIGTEQKTLKKYKNQKGEFHKETWSLNAKRYNPEFLTGLHDRHAAWNQPFNLKRGVKGSMRKHTDLKKFYSMVDKALSADYDKSIEKVIESLETSFLTKTVSLDEIREKFKPMMSTVLKQNKALREKYKLDLKEYAEALIEKTKEVDEELKTLEMRREVYSDAINKAQADAILIAEQQAEIKKLRSENEIFRTKFVQDKQKSAVFGAGISSKLKS